MKITYDASEPANTFSNLSYGDVFLYHENTYIKVRPFGNRNAVDLLTGDSVHLCPEEGIIPVDASLSVRPTTSASTSWRDEPATQKQLAYIQEMSEHSPYEFEPFTGTTKGEAADYISRHFNRAHENLWAITHGYD